MSDLRENIRAVSMECVGFVVVGGDVGASQYGADSRAAQVLTLPLTPHTGAVNRVNQSLHLERPAQIHNVNVEGEECTIFHTPLNMTPLG